MTYQTFARDLLAILCCLQGLATLAVDFNRTHATNPEWPGHARFHLVWQVATAAGLALFEVVLILASGPFQEQRFYLVAVLVGIPMLSFFAAFIAHGIYKGTLSDANGIQPLKITVRGSTLRIDLNLMAETCGVLALAVIVTLYGQSCVKH